MALVDHYHELPGGDVYTCEFPTMGAIATLTFSTDRGPQEIAVAVRSVFEHYDQRFPFDRFATEIRSLENDELQLGQISNELLEALRFAQIWRAHLDAPDANDAAIVPANLRASVTAMALESAASLLEAAGAERWSLDLNGEVVKSIGDPSAAGAGTRKNDADAYTRV